MGSRSRAQTQSSSDSVQNVETTTFGLDDVSGDGAIALQGGGDIDLRIDQTTTDFGAINSALDFAQDAATESRLLAESGIDAGTRLGESSLDFANEFGSNALRDALDFGGDALGSVERGLDRSLDFGENISASAFSFGLEQADNAKATAQTALSTLGRAVDQVADATRSDSANTLNRVSVVVGVAFVALAVAAIFLGRSRK